jgi:sugar phosphate permease
VIAVGLVLAGAGMLLTGFVNSFLPAALWRGLTGVGSGASNVPVMGLLMAWFAMKRRGLASGIAATGSSIALILVGPLVPHILQVYGDQGWRTSWIIFGGMALIVALLALVLLRNHPDEKNVGLLGAKEGEGRPESKSQPIQWGRVYRAAPVWQLGFVYIAFGFSYIIYLTFFTKRLIAEGGYSQVEAGSLFMTMGWFSLLCGLIWGSVSDWIGRSRALTLVYLIQAFAFCLFGLAGAPAGFTLSAILFGLTAWSIPAIMAAACGDVLGAQMAPAALGFITLFFGIGQAIGPSIAGAMADASGSFTGAYLLAGGVALVGALGSLLLRPTTTAEVLSHA